MKIHNIYITASLLAALPLLAACGAAEGHTQAPEAVNFAKVEIRDSFWLPRIIRLADTTLPACLDQCEFHTGRIHNFAVAAGLEEGEFQGIFYDDSDVYKMIEGCAYSLMNHPDSALEARLDGIIAKIAAAQQPDGYINTYYTVAEPGKRWTDMNMHEMYCGGHLIEAGIAYFNATGKRTLLDTGIRFADHIADLFGPGKRTWVPGHEEIELALVKLARITGENRYADHAAWLLEQRGHQNGEWGRPDNSWAQVQDSIPVADLEKITGHAVRAMYLFSGMADVAAYKGDTTYLPALDRLWDDVVGTKMYATGGIGSSAGNEGFTRDYDLPNAEAYCETCASVGMVMWNHRMNLLKGDTRYADVMERALYNGALAGIALSADRFFYVNPLESDGSHHRQPWYGTACCPSQISRFLPSVGGYIYAASPDDVWVNLYMGSSTTLPLGGTEVTLKQTTAYPWSGDVALTVNPAKETRFTLHLRIPDWCKGYSLSVEGAPVDVKPEKGYLAIDRNWKKDSRVELKLDMPVEAVAADPRVEADRGKRHLRRGPIVYCMEETDNTLYDNSVLSENTIYAAAYRPDLLGGIVAITATEGDAAYTFIPYYAWDNRAPGRMKVWVDYK